MSHRVGPLALLTAAVLLVFGQTIGFEFLQWDDDINVTENPHLVPGAGGVAHFWTNPYAGLYVPLPYTVFWAEARLSRAIGGEDDPDPRIFHAGNEGQGGRGRRARTVGTGCLFVSSPTISHIVGMES